ncbi:hypothetical protein Hypma_001392 [Hypsizygus marmoreus]|uniref:Uncharacterized protein n=1 Tax=Hypsizygus marmoreus TaxID=39966 RepID=A0A369K2G5_HYPMA|nr:hypothetical protein Hypma_001392 [Hypsizygus marmoreus]
MQHNRPSHRSGTTEFIQVTPSIKSGRTRRDIDLKALFGAWSASGRAQDSAYPKVESVHIGIGLPGSGAEDKWRLVLYLPSEALKPGLRV